jgi:hypothetical protein
MRDRFSDNPHSQRVDSPWLCRRFLHNRKAVDRAARGNG